MANKADDGLDQVAEELRQIKLLLIANLLRSGVKQSDIAALLGTSNATMSRMLPSGSRSFRPKGSE
jgi:predicted transcriptional regulator